MLIDDDEINNFIFIKLIKEAGIRASCTTSTNGQKALRKLKKWHHEGGKHYPDLILLDLDMPVMDGFEFLEEYEKQLYPSHQHVQLYMLSSSIRSEDRSRARSYASVSNFISKPLPIPALQEILVQYQLTQRRSSSS